MAGYSFDDIAAQVGYQSRGTAWRVVQNSLRARTDEVATEYRATELARLDAL